MRKPSLDIEGSSRKQLKNFYKSVMIKTPRNGKEDEAHDSINSKYAQPMTQLIKYKSVKIVYF